MASIPHRCVRLLAILFLLAMVFPSPACAAVLRNGDFSQVDPDRGPANWQITSFHDQHRPKVTAAMEAGVRHVAFLFADDGSYCSSFYQRLANFDDVPEFDQNGDLIVTFSYKAEVVQTGTLTVALSGDPGCGLPCVQTCPPLERDGKWHQTSVRLPLAGFVGKAAVLECVFTNGFKASDTLAVSEIKAEIACSNPIVGFNPVNPISGVLFTDMPCQTVAGLLTVAKTYANGEVRLCLAHEADPKKALTTQTVKISYPVTRWEMDLKSLPEGRYTLTAELLGDENKVVADKKIVLWKQKPTGVTTRVIDGRVYFGASPTLLLGTYHVSDAAVNAISAENARIGIPPITREHMLSSLAGQGFNSFIFVNSVPSSSFLDDSQKHHLSVMPSVCGLGREWGGPPLVEQIAPVKDDPRIFGWYGADEPAVGEATKSAVEVYYDLKSVSPHKLVVTAICAPSVFDAYEGQITPADLILMDIYAVSRPDSDLSLVGTSVKIAADYARKHGNIAVGVAPQAFIYTGSEPTPEQLRAQTYLGLVNGATAFFPYSYTEAGTSFYKASLPDAEIPSGMSLNPKRQEKWFLPDSKLWLVLPEIFRELKTLETFILEDGEVLQVKSENDAIQFMAKQVRGESWLIAVNAKAAPQRNAFDFPGPIGKVISRFNTPPTEAQGNRLSLEFKGYEVKAFQFEHGK